jgi:hypothetical protein
MLHPLADAAKIYLGHDEDSEIAVDVLLSSLEAHRQAAQD